MTGIMTAVAGSAKRINTGTGWYNQGTGAVDTSPIQENLTASFTDLVGTYTWVGYLRVATSGNYTMGIQTTVTENQTSGSTSTGQFWIGNNAITPTGTANIITNNSSGTYVISLTQGILYPCRFNWNFSLGYNFFFGSGASGLGLFRVNGSTNVTGLIFYNQATNGF
jgi:hypothetical protein